MIYTVSTYHVKNYHFEYLNSSHCNKSESTNKFDSQLEPTCKTLFLAFHMLYKFFNLTWYIGWVFYVFFSLSNSMVKTKYQLICVLIIYILNVHKKVLKYCWM